jgi:hypothetical protein
MHYKLPFKTSLVLFYLYLLSLGLRSFYPVRLYRFHKLVFDLLSSRKLNMSLSHSFLLLLFYYLFFDPFGQLFLKHPLLDNLDFLNFDLNKLMDLELFPFELHLVSVNFI